MKARQIEVSYNELIYYCLNTKLVLSQRFAENLMSYMLTTSKSYCNFLANRSPCGSHTYLQSWPNQPSNVRITFPDGSVKLIFDKTQKDSKTYIINGDNNVPTIIMTNHLNIAFDSDSAI